MGERMTAMDIEGQDFSLKVRGFDRDAVRLYLRSVAEEIEKLNLENASLREDVGNLKDKVEGLVPVTAAAGPRGVRHDVLSALENLGYRPRDAERALEKVEDPADQFENLLKQTLRVLAR